MAKNKAPAAPGEKSPQGVDPVLDSGTGTGEPSESVPPEPETPGVPSVIPASPRYRVLTPLNFGDRIAAPGETVELDSLAARELTACGAVELVVEPIVAAAAE